MAAQMGIELTAEHRDQIECHREKTGMTLTQIAAATASSGASISRIFAGQQRPSEPLLHAICREIGLACKIEQITKIRFRPRST